SPAISVGFPCHKGATCLSSLVLRNATICNGTGILTLTLVITAAKTARICSKRTATSRPRFSPASVATEKCGERTSTHCCPSARATGVRLPAASNEKHNLNQIERGFIATPRGHEIVFGAPILPLLVLSN